MKQIRPALRPTLYVPSKVRSGGLFRELVRLLVVARKV